MEKQLTTIKSQPGFSLAPRNFEEAIKFSEMIASSDLAPKEYRGKPANVLIAVQMGMETGLQPMQAIQNIAVINGRATLWGDAMLAVCLPYIKHEETFDQETMTATCKVYRHGIWSVETYSKKDAETAGLWGKAGPWKTAPKRMLKMRARGFALRDRCADLLRGIHSREEQEDIIRVKGDSSPPPPSPKPKLAPKPQDAEVVVEVQQEPGFLKIKDHERYKELVEAITEWGFEKKLAEVAKGEDWTEFTIDRFDGLWEYVVKLIAEAK